MVLEMKHALEALKYGDNQGYRKIYDATCEGVYCRSFVIIQDEAQAQEFTKEFYVELFRALDGADESANLEKWFWQKYYQRVRRQYHKLLEKQNKNITSARTRTLAEIPGALPLLHRIMAVMSVKDDFPGSDISFMFGLPEEKVHTELEKLYKVLPALTKGQPESVSAYLGSWNALFVGAFKQLSTTGSAALGQIYEEAAKAAGIAVEPAVKKQETFEYFVADVDLSPKTPAKKSAPVVEEEPDEDEDDDEYEDEYEDDEDGDEYEDEDDDEYDDGRYNWDDLEDDGRKMVILGIILALVILAAVVFGVSKLMDKDDKKEEVQTEQQDEEGDAELIIKGDGPGEDEEEEPVEEEPIEEEEEEPEEEPEPEVVKMEVDVSNTLNVRKESNTNSDVVTKLNRGEEVEILGDISQEWVQIRCIEQDNKEGYVKSEFLKAIE